MKVLPLRVSFQESVKLHPVEFLFLLINLRLYATPILVFPRPLVLDPLDSILLGSYFCSNGGDVESLRTFLCGFLNRNK